MFKFLSNLSFKVYAIIWIAMIGISSASPAFAQVGLAKTICDGLDINNCPPLLSPPEIGQTVHYQITLDNTGQPANTFTIQDDLPASFVPADPTDFITCQYIETNPYTILAVNTTVISNTPLQISVDLPDYETVTCAMNGYFEVPGAVAINTVFDPNDLDINGDPNTSASETTVVANVSIIPVDFDINKTPSTSTVNLGLGPQDVTYTITVTTDNDVYLDDYFNIYDQLALFPDGIPVDAILDQSSVNCSVTSSGGGGYTCPITADYSGRINHDNWGAFVSFGYGGANPILFQAGDVLTLSYTVKYSLPEGQECLAVLANGIKNRAFLGLANGSTSFNDTNSSNNDTGNDPSNETYFETGITDIDPDCIPSGNGPPSPLSVDKEFIKYKPAIGGTAGLSAIPWDQQYVEYDITITNGSATELVEDIALTDIYQNLPNTPNHQVQLYSITNTACPVTSVCTISSPNPGNPVPQGINNNIQSYFDQATLWKADIDELQPGETATFKALITLRNPACDFAYNLIPKRVRNNIMGEHMIMRPDPFTSVPTPKNFVSTDYVDSKVETTDPCDVNVKKTVLNAPNEVEFGQPMNYTIVFENGADPIQAGTLMDVVRLENDLYAVGLNTTYGFQCTDDIPGTVTNYVPAGSGSGSTSYVSAPHQGLRVMEHPGFVNFAPFAKLTCDIQVTVQAPAASDPYCFSNGTPTLGNAAIIDGSLFYNGNLSWPPAPQGTTWDKVSSELEKCYHLVVNKEVSPLTTTPNFGPELEYTVTITNASGSGTSGDFDFTPATNPWSGAVFTDTFQNGPFPTTLPQNTPVLVTDPCDQTSGDPCRWLTPLSTNGHEIGITRIPAGTSLTYSYKIPPNYTPHQICNDIEGELLIDGLIPDRWYAKDSRTLSNEDVCAKIRTNLEITKTLDIHPTITLPSNTSFTVDINCTPPSGFDPVAMSQTFTQSGLVKTQKNIIVGSQCTIVEQTPDESLLPSHCDWNTPTYPNGQTFTADGSVEPHTLSVSNSMTCRFGDLEVDKSFTGNGNPLDDTEFNFDVTCGDPSNDTYVVSLLQGEIGAQNDIPDGSSCAVTEQPLDDFIDDQGRTCVWGTPTYSPSNTAIIDEDNIQNISVSNPLNCQHLMDVQITKTLDLGDSGLTIPPSELFDINVNCTNPTTGDITVSETVQIGGNATHTINDVPMPSTCTISELPSTYTLPDNCMWNDPVYTNGQSHELTYIPGMAYHSLEVTNSPTCAVGGMTIRKSLNGNGTDFAPTTYPVEIACTSPYNVTETVDVIWGQIYNQSDIPAGSDCTITELPLSDFTAQSVDPVGILTEMNCVWEPIQYNPSNVVSVTDGVTDVIVIRNEVNCAPIIDNTLADLQITKVKTTPGNCHDGLTWEIDCGFDIIITNNGPGDYLGPITFTDDFDSAGGIGLSAQPSGWNCVPDTNTSEITCTSILPQNIPNGTSITIDLPITGINHAPPTQNCVSLDNPLVAADADDCVDITSNVSDWNLSIDKTQISIGDCHGAVIQGQPNPNHCEFAITVTNNGPGNYTGPLSVTDEVGTWSIPVISYSSGWTCSNPVPTQVQCDHNGNVDLDMGESVTVYVTINIDAPFPVPENCAEVLNPNTGAPIEVCIPIGQAGSPELDIQKELLPGQECASNTLCEFEITIFNNGNSAFSGPLSLHDTVTNYPWGSYVSNTGNWTCSGSGGTFPCDSNGNVLIPANSSTSFTLTLDLYSPVMPTENCVTLQQSAPMSDITHCIPLGDTTSILDIEKVKLTSGNCHDPYNQPTMNHCEFTITITNTGPDPLVDTDITFLDEFGWGIYNFQGPSTPIAYNPQPPWTCATAATGTECTLPDATLAVGQSTTLTITLDHMSYNGGWPEENCAMITSPAQSPMPEDCVPIVDQLSDLVITKTLADSTCSGPMCEYIITVTNNGPGTYSGPLNVNDTFTQYGTAQPYLIPITSADAWYCNPPSGPATQFDCNIDDIELTNGQSTSFTMPFDLEPGQETTNCAVLTNHPSGAPVQDCVTINEQPSGNLSVVKTLTNAAACQNGLNPCTFAVTITNNDGTDYVGPLGFDDTVSFMATNYGPVQSNYQGGLGSNWSCSSSSGWIGFTCDTLSDETIAANSSVTYTFTLDMPGNHADRNCVTMDNPNVFANPVSCVDFPTSSNNTGPSLDIEKTLLPPPSCNPSGSCTFEVTITNTGSTNFNDILTFNDDYQFNYTSITVPTSTSTAGWQCGPATPGYNCYSLSNVNLDPGDSVTITVTLDLTGQYPLHTNNCATLLNTGQSPDPLSCVGIGQASMAYLQIHKEIAADSDYTPPASTMYDFNAICGSSQFGPVSAAQNDNEIIQLGMTSGACTVSETNLPPLPDPSCSWDTPTYSPSNTVNVPTSGSATVIVTNRVTCGNPPQMGSIRVEKSYDTSSGDTPPSGVSFPFEVNCINPAFSTVVNVPVGGVQPPPLARPDGSVCTVSELPITASAGANCTWNAPVYVNGQSRQITAGVTSSVQVMNSVDCVEPVLEGTLQVNKTYLQTSDWIQDTLDAQYLDINCVNANGNPTFAASPAFYSTGYTSPTMPGGSICTVTENVNMDPLPAGCAYDTPLYSPANTVTIPSNGTGTVTITNNVTCAPNTGTLEVSKVYASGSDWIPPNVLHQLAVNCVEPTTGQPIFSSNVALGTSGTSVNTIPADSQCTVTETINTVLLPQNCTYLPAVYSPASTLVPSGGSASITVTNEVICTQPGPTGTVQVNKTYGYNSDWTPPAGTTHQVNVNCINPNNGSTVYSNSGQAGSNPLVLSDVPAGSQCTIAEIPNSAGMPSNCSWDAPMYGSPPSQIVTANGTLIYQVHNNATCNGFVIDVIDVFDPWFEGDIGVILTGGGDVITGGDINPLIGVVAEDVGFSDIYRPAVGMSLGMGLPLSEKVSVTAGLEYRKFNGGEAQLGVIDQMPVTGQMGDMEQFGLNVGMRYTFDDMRLGDTRTLRPYVGARVGAMRTSGIALENARIGNRTFNGGTVGMYKPSWSPTLEAVIGAEIPINDNFRLGFETGLQYMGALKSDDSYFNPGIPLAGTNNFGGSVVVPLRIKASTEF